MKILTILKSYFQSILILSKTAYDQWYCRYVLSIWIRYYWYNIVNIRLYREYSSILAHIDNIDYRSCTGPVIKTNYRIPFPIGIENKMAQHAILNDSYSHHVGLWIINYVTNWLIDLLNFTDYNNTHNCNN